MENKDLQVQLSTKQGFPEELPSLLKCIASPTIAGFDSAECSGMNYQTQLVTLPNPQEDATVGKIHMHIQIHKSLIEKVCSLYA